VTYLSYIGIGSNLGDRLQYCQKAVSSLTALGTNVTKVSSLYETDPVDYIQQANFYNAVLEITTQFDPLVLLEQCQQIERGLEKKIDIPKGPRTIDLDILFMAVASEGERLQICVTTPYLTIPHPSALKRRFVLIPMAEIAPDFCPPLPPGGNARGTIQSILDAMPNDQSVRKVFDPEWVRA